MPDQALSDATLTPEADLRPEMDCAHAQANCKSAATEQADMKAADARGDPSEAAADGETSLLTQPSKPATKSSGTATVAEDAKSNVPKGMGRRASKVQLLHTHALLFVAKCHQKTRFAGSQSLILGLPAASQPVFDNRGFVVPFPY